jgi:hypothetical protein
MFAHFRIGWYVTLPFPALFLALAAAALAFAPAGMNRNS